MSIKAIKGFNKGMITHTGFQYEEGKEYENHDAICCETGFHACEDPMDLLVFYYPAKSIFHEVVLDGKIDKSNFDSKVAATKIKIGKKLSVTDIIDHSIEFRLNNINEQKTETNNDEKQCNIANSTGESNITSSTGKYSVAISQNRKSVSISTSRFAIASSTGNHSISSVTDRFSASSTTGNHSTASATGERSIASSGGKHNTSSVTSYESLALSTGDHSTASASGYECEASTTGNFSISSTTGEHNIASTTGFCSASVSTGFYNTSEAMHETAIAVAWGPETSASGVIGSHLLLSDWEFIGEKYQSGAYQYKDSIDNWKLRGSILVEVDGEKIKENVHYRYINGEIVETDKNQE